MISINELYWAAGFLEGEGSFTTDGRRIGSSVRLQAGQVQREPLDRLLSIFGGKIMWRMQNSKPFYLWRLNSRRSAQVMLTLYVLMSPRRQEQIVSALKKWRTTRAIRLSEQVG